ncbi:MAG TPA: S4 domain-containing protein YaaA [Acholeplasmataceae bacterium]|nr:S4 domain-containing protein YaaA [Acholeplasmataceae bacterium]
MKLVTIKTEFITLGQFLKFVHIIASGAEAKSFLQINDVFVNEELERRRGRKLYPGDTISFGSNKYRIGL